MKSYRKFWTDFKTKESVSYKSFMIVSLINIAISILIFCLRYIYILENYEGGLSLLYSIWCLLLVVPTASHQQKVLGNFDVHRKVLFLPVYPLLFSPIAFIVYVLFVIKSFIKL